MAITVEEMEEDIDNEDGTVCDPYQGVETYYCRLETIFEDERGFLRIIGDSPGCYQEIRVPFEVLEQNGWMRNRAE